ncbi:SDR family NAD(P)-dependent oxidoreductase [Anaerosporobacter sp.]|uniref:SDR family NAD(P)-dependent oxidoreductase n=1 Tax=Anaerosporobacter sp. TaxID=1872529 RepID=UPI00286F25E1|nr:SDR family NAD(P)-dependent oxidoreductase [Anaerosporobacter sp.]
MQKRIAIVTGASGGIGKAFTKLMILENVDEIWAIARNKEKLAHLQNEFGKKIIPLSKDLASSSELHSIGQMLEEEKPTISFLINNAGVARMGLSKDFGVDEIQSTIDINCRAFAVLCTLCVPYMKEGSRIINISSAASFQPLPYLNLYSATKAFERYYSRALNVELKGTGITSTAVCPSWVDTDLLEKELNGKKIRFPDLISADKVAQKALKDAKRGKDMSVCKLHVKFDHLLTKIFSQKACMRTWLGKTKNYI